MTEEFDHPTEQTEDKLDYYLDRITEIEEQLRNLHRFRMTDQTKDDIRSTLKQERDLIDITLGNMTFHYCPL